MTTLSRDLRYAARTLARQPVFTLVAIGTLALGIGGNTAIFSMVDAILVRALPYPEPDRLAVLWTTNPENGWDKARTNGLDYQAWRDQSETFQGIALLGGGSVYLTDRELPPAQLPGVAVMPNYFSVLGVPPAVGRTFTDEDNHADAEPVVILSHALWISRFGSDPELVGRTITVDGTATTVVGVMPPLPFPISAPTSAHMPLSYDTRHVWYPALQRRNCVQSRRCHVYAVFGRLAPDVTLEQAQLEMSGIARGLEEEYPATNTGDGVLVLSMHDEVTGGVRPALLVLLGAVGLVLLIACANLANLLLVRAANREAEVAVRTALGATRGRLVQQFLTESLLLCGIGGVAGLVLALVGMDLLVGLYSGDLPREQEIGLHGSVLAFNLLLSIVVGVVVGLLPAHQGSKTKDLSPGALITRGATQSRRKRWVRNGLVVGEVAVAVVLLLSASLMLKSFWRLLQVDPGFEPARVLVAQLTVPPALYDEHQELNSFTDRALANIRALPGVQFAASGMDHPLQATWIDAFNVDGRPRPRPENTPLSRFRPVGPGYFRATGISVLRGRSFTERDVIGQPGVVVINESLARRYFPNDDPIGQRLSFGAPRGMWQSDDIPSSWEIVGVVNDVKFLGVDGEVEPAYYVPFAQGPYWWMKFFVRVSGDPEALAAAVRQAIVAADPAVPPPEMETMEGLYTQSVGGERFNAILLAAFGGRALVLAAMGIYGVISYTAAQRTREMGIRIALGAVPGTLVHTIVGEGLGVVAIGLALGMAGALVSTRLLSGLLFGVSATDPVLFVAVPAMLALVAALASFAPARRASKLDPMLV